MRGVVLIAFLSLAGCAWFQEQRMNVAECFADTACRTEAVERSKEYGQRAEDVASLSGVPWAGKAAKAGVGYASLVVLLSTLGAAIRKKKRSS